MTLTIVILTITIIWCISRLETNKKTDFKRNKKDKKENVPTYENLSYNISKVSKNGSFIEVSTTILDDDNLPMNYFVIVDVETTGLRAQKDSIIEIAAIKVDLNNNETQTFQRFIKIDKKLDAFIVNLTGITNSMLNKDGVSIKEAMQEFKWFVGEYPLVAHNAEFDAGFIVDSALREGVYITNDFVDTLNLSRTYLRGMSNYKLKTLADELNLDGGVSHRAMGDCETTLELYKILIEEVKQRNKIKEFEMFFAEFKAKHIDLLTVIAYFVKADNKFTKQEKEVVFEHLKKLNNSEYMTYDNVNKKIFNKINDLIPNKNKFKKSLDVSFDKYGLDVVYMIADIAKTWKDMSDEVISAMDYVKNKIKV